MKARVMVVRESPVNRIGKQTANAACRERLARFFHESGRKAFNGAYGISGNAEQAEELVQEASYRAIRSWRSYDPSKPMDSWFYAVMRNAYLDVQRRFDRARTVSLDATIDATGDLEFADAFCDGADDHLQRMEREEAIEAVRKAIGTLSEELRDCLRLSEFEQLSYEEIARIMDIPVGTVRSRIWRARLLLRDRLPEFAY